MKAVEVCMYTGQLTRMDGTCSWLEDRRQKSSRCSRKSSTDQLHLGVERERHSGCSGMDGTSIQNLRSCREMELWVRRAESVTWLQLWVVVWRWRCGGRSG